MTLPGSKTTGSPAAVTGLSILAVFWAIAGLALGLGLWHDPPAAAYGKEEQVLAANVGSVTVIALCVLGATVSAVGGAIVDQLGKRRSVETE